MASQTIVDAGKGLTKCTLKSLLEEYGLGKNILNDLSKIKDIIEHYGLLINPPIGEFGIDYPRTLKPIYKEEEILKKIKNILDQGGENYLVELKESIFINTKKKKFNSNFSIEECVDEKLKRKVSQEICAFLNRDGGYIIFGVRNDDHAIMGCLDDLEIFPAKGSYSDLADLIIKKIVEKYFIHPISALNNIQIDCVEIESKPCVLLSIVPSDSLQFLKKEALEQNQLYIRNGTSAEPIPFVDIEKYYKLTRKSN